VGPKRVTDPEAIQAAIDGITLGQLRKHNELKSTGFIPSVANREKGIISFGVDPAAPGGVWRRAPARSLAEALGVKPLPKGCFSCLSFLKGPINDLAVGKVLRFFAACVFRGASVNKQGAESGSPLDVTFAPIEGVQIVVTSTVPHLKGYRGSSLSQDSEASLVVKSVRVNPGVASAISMTARLTRPEDREKVSGYTLLQKGLVAFFELWRGSRASDAVSFDVTVKPGGENKLLTKVNDSSILAQKYLDPFLLDMEGHYNGPHI